MSLLLLLDHLATNYSRGTAFTLPTDNSNLATTYATSEYPTVASDDSTYVGVTGEPYLIHEFKYQAPNSTQGITITWNGNSTTAPSLRPVYLQIWNITSSTWETIATNNTAAASVDFTLTAAKSTSLSSYYGTNSIVTARVYQ